MVTSALQSPKRKTANKKLRFLKGRMLLIVLLACFSVYGVIPMQAASAKEGGERAPTKNVAIAA
jgi:hypothetical protein